MRFALDDFSSDEEDPSDDGLLDATLTRPRPPPSESDSSDDDDDDDGWGDEPAGPVGSIGVRGWHRSTTDADRAKARVRLLEGTSVMDPWEVWEEKQKAGAWAMAQKNFFHSFTSSQAASSRSGNTWSTTSDLPALQSLLSSLSLAHTESVKQLRTTFEERNTVLWAGIEASIREAEREVFEREKARERAAEEARQQQAAEAEAARKKAEKEEQERKAKEAEKLKEEEARLKKEKEDEAKRLREALDPSAQQAKEEFEAFRTKMNTLKETVLVPAKAPTNPHKKALSAARRSMTAKIGQLTNDSPTILRIIEFLKGVLDGLQAADGSAYAWGLNALSKLLIKQAQEEVTAKTGAAYPLARVVVGLVLRGHAALGKALSVRLAKKCFWITGWRPPRRKDESPEDYRRTLGHSNNAGGEASTQYALRMGGLVALWAAILQTSPIEAPQANPTLSAQQAAETVPLVLRPAHGWSWIQRIIRSEAFTTPTISPETPALLATFLLVAGETYMTLFGRQFTKLLQLLLHEGLMQDKLAWKAAKDRSGVTRLEIWLEDAAKGKVRTEEGRNLEDATPRGWS